MSSIITFLAINEKKTNPNGQCYGDYRIDKVIPFPFIRPIKQSRNQHCSNDIFAISKDKSPNFSLFLVFMAQI